MLKKVQKARQRRVKSAPEACQKRVRNLPSVAGGSHCRPTDQTMSNEKAGIVAVRRGQWKPLRGSVNGQVAVELSSSRDYRHRRRARVNGTTAKNCNQKAIPHSQAPASI